MGHSSQLSTLILPIEKISMNMQNDHTGGVDSTKTAVIFCVWSPPYTTRLALPNPHKHYLYPYSCTPIGLDEINDMLCYVMLGNPFKTDETAHRRVFLHFFLQFLNENNENTAHPL